MNIVKERTRIIFSDYTDAEKHAIKEMVVVGDNFFLYEDIDNNTIAFLPGMTELVKKQFPNVKIIDNSNQSWDAARIDPVVHSAKPRSQLQIDFINFVLSNAKNEYCVAGILEGGTGKTFMACYCAIELGLRTLIIAPTSSIKAQWGETLTEMFKVKPENVKLMKSPRDFFNVTQDFIITTQSSLAILNKSYDLQKMMKANKFGIKVIDEAHMFYGNTVKVDGCSNIRHNWYMTGTFGRSSDEENTNYHKQFGEIKIFQVKNKKPTLLNPRPGNQYGDKPHCNVTMVWGKSGLTKAEVKSVSKSVRYSEREGKWLRFGIAVPAYTNLIIPKDGSMTIFLKLVLDTIDEAEKKVDYGRTLILTTTISSCSILEAYMKKKYPGKTIGTIHSYNKKEYNEKVKAECDMIISTISSAGTGFDAKGLSKLIFLGTMKSPILTSQVVWRLRRRNDGKETYAWDIVDSTVPQLRAWANCRADVEKRICKTFKVKTV